MRKLLIIFGFIGCWLGPVNQASAIGSGLRAAVFVDDGEFLIWSEGPGSFNLSGYTLTSPSQNLITGNWLSITNFYDANSGGLVDSDDNWSIISQTSADLSEGEFNGNGGLLQPNLPISLGNIWPLTAPRSLTLTAIDGNVAAHSVDVAFITPGDYDADEDVDLDDYAIWRANFGSVSAGLFTVGDGNADGFVDAADYTVWRDNLSGPSSGAASLSLLVPYAVPEPTSTVLLALGAVVITSRLVAQRLVVDRSYADQRVPKYQHGA